MRRHQFRAKCIASLLLLAAGSGVASAQGRNCDVWYHLSNGESGCAVELQRLGPRYIETYPQGGVAAGPTFSVEYLDVTNNANIGFDHPTLGATRRATAQAVFNYLGTVITNTGSAEIVFNASQTDGTGSLAFMGPTFWTGTCEQPWTVTHITTSTDPDPSGTYSDAVGAVDFGYNYNDDLGAPAGNEYDLFTVLLHEVVHGLGFLSSLGTGSSPPPPGVALRYVPFDTMLRQAGSGTALVICPSGQYLGGDLQGAPGVVLNGTNVNSAWAAIGGTGSPPLYTPVPFRYGSIGHFHDGASMPADVVMRPVTFIGTQRRELHALDAAALADIGYQIGVTSNCCVAHDSTSCDDTTCVGMVCAQDIYCCSISWDTLCANLANQICEVCTMQPSHDCCMAHEAPGCTDPSCQAGVCAQDAFCCNTTWDAICANTAVLICNVCTADVASDCCGVNGSPGCDDEICEAAVCAQDSFCCSNTWDPMCAELAIQICHVCGGSSCQGDTNGDSIVNVDDLVNVILDWGTSGAQNGGDVDGSGVVNVDDLVLVVLQWGPCG